MSDAWSCCLHYDLRACPHHPSPQWGMAGVQKSEAEASNDGSGVGVHQIGHYEVETHKGDKMTQAELHGDFALMYFGTTNSPDTVSELERLAEIVGFSGKHARKVTHVRSLEAWPVHGCSLPCHSSACC